MKLQGLTEDIVIIPANAEEWATCQNILIMNGRQPSMVSTPETYDTHPHICVWYGLDSFTNVQWHNSAKNVYPNIPASTFIASNTNLADTTTNNNQCSIEGANI